MPHFPVVLLGEAYWRPVPQLLQHLANHATIADADLELLLPPASVTDGPRARTSARGIVAAPSRRHGSCNVGTRVTSLHTAREATMRERLGTIVVAVDFSETSEDAWAAACRLAAATGSQVHLLHVSPDPLRQAWTVEAVGVDFSAITEEWRLQAAARLAMITPLAGLAEDRITRVVVTGVPHRAITEYAAAARADLIVVGTHGYGPIRHLLLGSVAERVVRQAQCPVMTVPHRSTPARAPEEATPVHTTA
jgi:nucleotide-binding universal stress UspA family protein